MKIDCPQCGQEIALAQINTSSQSSSLRCVRCQQTIVVLHPGSAPQLPSPQTSIPISELTSVLREILAGQTASSQAGKKHQGREDWRRVLLCFGNSSLREEISSGLNRQVYEVLSVDDVIAAITAIRDSKIDILVLDPLFDLEEKGRDKLMDYLHEIHPRARREIFVVLVAPQFKSLDSNAAFIEQVNLVVNPRSATGIQHLLERTLREYEEYYRSFHEIKAQVS